MKKYANKLKLHFSYKMLQQIIKFVHQSGLKVPNLQP